MRRVGPLTGLLVLVLGAGTVAQSPSPEPTPPFAPDDLANAVPSRIGSLDLYVRVAAGDAAFGSDPEDRAYWGDFIAAQGKEATDMLAAYGVTMESSTDPALEVWAVRVVGLQAEGLMEPTLVTSDTDLSDIPPGGHADWRDLEGRRVLLLTADDADHWRAYYPNGEVLFVVYGDDRTAVEDVLPALGTGAVAQSPTPSPGVLPETSPVATPPFAPDDLGALLPLELGGVSLTVEERTGAEAMADSSGASTAMVRDALLPLGADPRDMSDAIAFTTDASAPEQYQWSAWRVPGVPADALFDVFVQMVLQASGETLPAGFMWPNQVIDGRSIITFDAPDAVSWQAFYPKGEVLFILQGEGGVTLAEAVAVLP